MMLIAAYTATNIRDIAGVGLRVLSKYRDSAARVSLC
jgi:hypothetical protein